jgi:hypothetical protein
MKLTLATKKYTIGTSDGSAIDEFKVSTVAATKLMENYFNIAE